jgi:hypothetical protein
MKTDEDLHGQIRENWAKQAENEIECGDDTRLETLIV